VFQKLLHRRVKSFGYAWNGIVFLFKTQPNFIIHTLAMILVMLAGWFFKIHANEWLACFICFGLMLSAEAINTALEELVNLVEPNFNPKAGIVKDVAAAAVLFAALCCIIVGLFIFLPKILLLF
jgi:diacylglycerol kinase